MIPNFPLICKGIYEIPSSPTARTNPFFVRAVQMGFAGSLGSLIKCWGRRVAKKETGGLPKRFWRKEKQGAALPVEKPKQERGEG